MKGIWKACAALVLAAGALLAAGCPRRPPTFEVWLLNTSSQATLSSMKITAGTYGAGLTLAADLPPKSARVFSGLDAARFGGPEVVVEVTGTTGLQTVRGSLALAGPLADGDTLPVVASGNAAQTFRVEHAPLEPASKGLLMMRKDFAGNDLAN